MSQPTLFDGERTSLAHSLAVTAESLNLWGAKYDHWAVAFSGGKDSSATVTAVVWLIATGRVKAPKSLTVLYADTRMEMPPLHATAMNILRELEAGELKHTLFYRRWKSGFSSTCSGVAFRRLPTRSGGALGN